MFCPKCGKEVHDSAFMCEYCGQTLKQDNVTPVAPADAAAPTYAPVIPEKKENVVAGIVGAVLGALIGAAAIILLNMIGYVASISGIILAVCTFKGYELLGGKLSVKGIIISLILIIVTPFIADWISWGIAIYQAFGSEYGITVADAIGAVGPFLQDGAIEKSDYTTGLLMLYGFTALGAFSSVRGTIKGSRKNK